MVFTRCMVNGTEWSKPKGKVKNVPLTSKTQFFLTIHKPVHHECDAKTSFFVPIESATRLERQDSGDDAKY